MGSNPTLTANKNEIQDIQPPRGVFRVALIEYQTVIVMAEYSINAVKHNRKELAVAPNEIR